MSYSYITDIVLTAVCVCVRVCCRLAWLKWQRSLAAKRQFCVMDSVALHHWAFKLQKRVCIQASYLGLPHPEFISPWRE